MNWKAIKGRPSVRGSVAPIALDEILPVFAMELARARRYERPLSVLSAPSWVLSNERIPLRLTDVVASASAGRIIALLIESDSEDATALADRIRREASVDDVRVASFPEDALTLDGLIAEVD